jgi:hypothetical protein
VSDDGDAWDAAAAFARAWRARGELRDPFAEVPDGVFPPRVSEATLAAAAPPQRTEARERIERMLELLRQPGSRLIVSPDVLEQAPPGMLERMLCGQLDKLHVDRHGPPGLLVAVTGSTWEPPEPWEARPWDSVRHAFGVVQGEPADAVADTDALHDEPGEGER